MYAQDTKPPSRLLDWIHRLSHPHPSILDEDEINRAWVLSGMTFMTTVIACTILGIRLLEGQFDMLTFHIFYSSIISIVIWRLSLTRHYRYSIYLIMIAAYITTAVILPLITTPLYNLVIIAPIYIITLIIDPWWALAYVILSVTTQTAMLYWHYMDWDTILFPITFTTLSSAGIIITGVILDYNRKRLYIRQQEFITSESHFRQLAENSPDSIFIMEMRTFRVDYTNRSALLGYPLDDTFIPNMFWELVHPDDYDTLQAHYNTLITGNLATYDGSEVDYRLRNSDGEWEWVRSRQTVLDHQAESSARHLLVTLTLITAQKQAQEQLKASETRYRLMADNATDMISRHQADTSAFLYVSPVSVQLLGYEPDELIGHDAYEFVHPDDIAAIRETHLAVREGRPDYQKITYRIRHKGGHYIWFETTRGLIRDPDDPDKSEIMCISRDVTERKLHQDQLAQDANRFRRLFNQAVDGIILHDIDGRIHDVNDKTCEMLGYSRDELLQMNVPDIDIAWTQQAMKDTLEQNVYQLPLSLEGIDRRKDGFTFPVEIRANWFELNGQKLVLSFVRDITERREAQKQQLELLGERERVQALQKFIDDISHDLMTPITTLNTGIYLLERTLTDDKQQQRVDKLAQQVQTLSTTIQDMLTMSRLDRPIDVMFDFKPQDLNAIVQYRVQKMKKAADERNHQVHLTLHPALPTCTLDADRLDHALKELLDNAIKYTEPGGTIRVSTGVIDDGCVQVTVQDTGTGINAKTLPHIFERLYRGDEHRPMNGGTGLGLSIAQRIAEAHNGSIEVESQPGEGSVFRIILPASAGEIQAHQKQ